jgi:hypothetical protein
MTSLPNSYFIAIGLFILLLMVSIANNKAAWAIPFGTVTVTLGAWYLLEPFYFPRLFAIFDFSDVEDAYTSVCIFFAALLVATPFTTKQMRPKTQIVSSSASDISADRIAVVIILVWLALLAFGTWRLNGDLINALFPLEGRAGVQMWSRAAGAEAGNSGFIVSSASYIYTLCAAFFGVLMFFVKKRQTKFLLLAFILTSWPYSFLQGSRNIVLATVTPGTLAFLLFGRAPFFVKFAVTLGGLLALDLAFRVIITFRDTGFNNVDLSVAESASHSGLNMASELVYITTFLRDGTLDWSYGGRYLAELINLIPRAVWPDKPLIGVDYAVARGFGSSGSSGGDIGVFATISTGAIGQGVLNFGNLLGPVAAAVLLSVWIGILTRFRLQATPLRSGLFLVGLGLTFNLGRDVTLLVLWPFVFGYLGVRLVEYNERRSTATGIVYIPHRP